jgi:hypothetical protein
MTLEYKTNSNVTLKIELTCSWVSMEGLGPVLSTFLSFSPSSPPCIPCYALTFTFSTFSATSLLTESNHWWSEHGTVSLQWIPNIILFSYPKPPLSQNPPCYIKACRVRLLEHLMLRRLGIPAVLNQSTESASRDAAVGGALSTRTEGIVSARYWTSAITCGSKTESTLRQVMFWRPWRRKQNEGDCINGEQV